MGFHLSDCLTVRNSDKGRNSWSESPDQVVGTPYLASSVLVDHQDSRRPSSRCGPLTFVWLVQTAIDSLTIHSPITTSLRFMVIVKWRRFENPGATAGLLHSRIVPRVVRRLRRAGTWNQHLVPRRATVSRGQNGDAILDSPRRPSEATVRQRETRRRRVVGARESA